MDGPYVFEHGDVWYRPGPARPGTPPVTREGHRVCGPSDTMSVVYDAVHGVLVKAGSSEAVERWRERSGTALEAVCGDVGVVTFVPLPEAVEELNACLATTGRIARFEEALARIAEAHHDVVPCPVPR